MIDRLNGESDFDYHKRIIYGKLVDKTLGDIDYSELSEDVYGQQYSSDFARRMMYGSCKTLQLLEACTDEAMPADVLAKIDRERVELIKERQRFFDQRREYQKIIAQEGRTEHLYDRLASAADQLEHNIGMIDFERRPAGIDKENEAILVLCDWHYGMTTNNIWNTYNTEICVERVQKLVSDARERLLLHSCRRLHVIVLGDMIHGAIHTSARVVSEELVCDQVMNVSEILAQAIEYLSSYVDEAFVYMTYGNHARTIQNKDESVHRDNMERLIPWWIKYRLKGNEKIIVTDPPENEFLFMDISGFGFCATHGDLDNVKTAGGIFPNIFQKKFGKVVDYIILADKHHRESLDAVGVLSAVCGSLCGTDDYANNKRLYSTPEQTLLIVNPSDGIDAEYHIRF